MLPRLARWKAQVKDTVVDTVGLRVVLRIAFLMTPRVGDVEGGETVENDLVWAFDMEEVEGEGGVRIKKSVEFVDGVAAGRLREIMMRGANAAGEGG